MVTPVEVGESRDVFELSTESLRVRRITVEIFRKRVSV